MEYSTIFGKFDWDTVRRGKFQGKSGNFMSIARIIYNGLSYNFGSQDGAVTIMEGFTVWRFIAPVDRFAMDDYAEMTLREALEEIVNETEAVPVPAWDEFCSFLSGREDMANAAILGHDIIRIGGVRVNFPPIQNCSDFCTFMRWLSYNVGEAGNLPAGYFIEGQDMTIPLDMYAAMPISFTLKTPTMNPGYTEDMDGGAFMWGKCNGLFNDPVFLTDRYLYAFEQTTDKNGAIVPQGWSVVDSADGETFTYTSHDMTANPVTLPYTEEMGEVNYGLKLFADIEYDESTEVHDGTITFLFHA